MGREGAGGRRRREAARRRAEELEAALAEVADLRPGGPVRAAAIAAATLVHLLGAAVLATGIWLLTLGLVTGYVGAFLCLGTFWVVRPRLGRLGKKEEWARREDLPLFFGLLDRAGAAIGAPVPKAVRLPAVYSDGGMYFNASTSRVGLRRTPTLEVGIPLWQVLSRLEREALLGHELGHQVNGDPTGSLFVGSARMSLAHWRDLFTPPVGRRGIGRSNVYEVLSALLLLPLYCSAIGLERLFAWIGIHVSLRAEYLADEMAARAAGTEAALSLLRKMAVQRTVLVFVQREKARRGRVVGLRALRDAEAGTEVWTGLAAFLAAVPEHEYERQARVSEVRGTAVDAGHPADYLRARFLRARPPMDRALTLSDEEWDAVEKELYPYVAAAGVSIVR